MKNNQQRGVDGPQPRANFFVLTIEANETPAGLFLRPPGGHEKLAAQVIPDCRVSLVRPTFCAHQVVAILWPCVFGSSIFSVLAGLADSVCGLGLWVLGR